ncbi:hypothetical protein [Aestuariivirga sp.]|uniref:hypothetical protein n=1 Tax=Aestuariivirga sp. TaxID=2650926 RepID=UPI0035930AF8
MNRGRGTGLFAALVLLLLPQQAFAIDGSGEAWGSRDPGSCTSIRLDGPPGPEQVADMLRCKHDVDVRGELWLMENIAVTVAPGVPLIDLYNTYNMENGDVTATVYPISGSFTWAVCTTRKDAALYGGNPDLNCKEHDVPSAKGVCWPTVPGDWKCLLTGGMTVTRGGTRPPQ